MVNLCRLSGTGPVLDLSFLIDHVMMDIKPLHWHKVIGSDVPLKVRLLGTPYGLAALMNGTHRQCIRFQP